MAANDDETTGAMNSTVVDIIGPVLNIYYCYQLGVLCIIA